MKRITIFAVIICCVFILLFGSAKSEENLTVVEIKDVDHLKLSDGSYLSWLGVYIPTIDKTFRKHVIQEIGYLVDGKILRINRNREMCEAQNKLVAYVYADGIFVNEYLIRKGYAFFLPPPKACHSSTRLRDAEKFAKAEKLGLWAGENWIDEPCHCK
jgi:hypothetical protein